MPFPAAKGALRRLRQWFQPPPIASVGQLRAYVEERALLIAQKCAIDYVRGKTGLASHALFSEKTFLEALDVCRWETFAAALGDLMILVEGCLRGHAAPAAQSRLCDALARLYGTILSEQARPAHRPQGWADAIADFEARLTEASRAAPRLARDIAGHTAKRLFDTLPIHADLRRLDEEPVYGSVQFRMIAVNQELQRRVAAAAIARELTA